MGQRRGLWAGVHNLIWVAGLLLQRRFILRCFNNLLSSPPNILLMLLVQVCL
jgi:hypothetical protein